MKLLNVDDDFVDNDFVDKFLIDLLNFEEVLIMLLLSCCSRRCCVILTDTSYYTIPSLDVCDRMVDDTSCVVTNFTIGQSEHGEIHFPGETDIYGLDLDKLGVCAHPPPPPPQFLKLLDNTWLNHFFPFHLSFYSLCPLQLKLSEEQWLSILTNSLTSSLIWVKS